MLDDPGRIDAHVVGHHVARQPDAVAPSAVAQVRIRQVAAEVARDIVLLQRIGGGDGIGVPAQVLDAFGSHRALPQPDQPKCGHAAIGQQPQLLVGDHVQLVDVLAVFARKLLQPNIGAFGHHDDVGHPRLVGGKRLVFIERCLVVAGVPSPHPSPHTVRADLIHIVEADVFVAFENPRRHGPARRVGTGPALAG